MDLFGRTARRMHAVLYKILHPRFKGVVLYGTPRVYYPSRLKIGDGTHVNDSVFINAVGGVEIGRGCVLSHGVSIISTKNDTDKWVGRNIELDIHVNEPICIGDNVWICANATICSGVSIPNDCIIAAGAVVTHSLTESGCMYGGIPARKIKVLRGKV